MTFWFEGGGGGNGAVRVVRLRWSLLYLMDLCSRERARSGRLMRCDAMRCDAMRCGAGGGRVAFACMRICMHAWGVAFRFVDVYLDLVWKLCLALSIVWDREEEKEEGGGGWCGK